MSINLDELSVDELEKLIKQAESALDKKRKAELKNAQAVLEKMAKDLGVSPEALCPAGVSRNGPANSFHCYG